MLEHGQRSVRVEYRDGDQAQCVEFNLDGLSDNEEFQRILRERDVQTIHSCEASLADVFIRVTGRELA